MFLTYLTENGGLVYIKPETVFTMETLPEHPGLVSIVLSDNSGQARVMVKGDVTDIAHDIELALTPRSENATAKLRLNAQYGKYPEWLKKASSLPNTSWVIIKNGVILVQTFNEDDARRAYKVAVSANYGRPFTLIELWHNGDVVKHNGGA